jgi:hypothetical protein
MDIGSVLLSLVAPRLQPFGFDFDEMDKSSWRFARKVGETTQYITFVKSRHRQNSLKVHFSTSSDPLGVESWEFIEGGENDRWVRYHDEASFVAAVEQLLAVTIERGIPWLDASVTRRLELPSEATSQTLLSDPHGLAMQLVARLQLKGVDPAGLPVVERFLIDRKAHAGGSSDWEAILQASAYLGEVIRLTLGGSWGWDDQDRSAAILAIGGKPNLKAAPLGWVCYFWSDPDDPRNGLASGYRVYKNLAEFRS